MGLREYDYIKGNTAIKPRRKNRVEKPKKNNRQIKQRKKENLLKNIRQNDRKYMSLVVGIVFVLGSFTIAHDNKVYKMQREVSNIDTQISSLKEENEALKVTILKYSSLSNIETNAQSKLAMSIPTSEDIVKIDFSENYFQDISQETTEETKKSGLFSKIIGFFTK